MKKSTIIIFLVLAMLKTQAQDYQVSFAGTGATTVVSTVKVDNLTSGATVTLNGGDVLHLIGGVGISTPDIKNGTLQIYPNPMAEQSILTFVAPDNDHAVIGIVDLSGKNVYQISTLLSPGVNSFRVSGISRGMCFVKVNGKNYHYSAKLVSQSNLQDETKIEHVSFAKHTASTPLKSTETTIDMLYTEGDQLLYKGISGIYSTLIPDVPASSKTITFNFAACTDGDNNNYTIVQIGTQTWMVENLKTTKYNNGTSIPLVTDNSAWAKLNTHGYCWYNNDDATYKNTYGALYNWFTVHTAGLAPAGWHLATDAEFTTLTDYLGGESVAGGKLKETGITNWLTPNTGATNESGFSANPGGLRYYDGSYATMGKYSFWWSSTTFNTSSAWARRVYYSHGAVDRYYDLKTHGFSVRCVRDL